MCDFLYIDTYYLLYLLHKKYILFIIFMSNLKQVKVCKKNVCIFKESDNSFSCIY